VNITVPKLKKTWVYNRRITDLSWISDIFWKFETTVTERRFVVYWK